MSEPRSLGPYQQRINDENFSHATLWGKKENGKNWRRGGLVNRQVFPRPILCIGICRENFLFVVTYFLLLAFGLYTQMLHHSTMTKKHRWDLINYKHIHITIHSFMYFFIWMYKNEICLAWVVFLHLKDNRNVHNYKFLYRTIYKK